MIVRLTHAQWAGVRARGPEIVVDWMAEHRRAVGRSHDYVMPAIGWRMLLDAMTKTAYGPVGGKIDRTPESVYRAIQRIADRVGAIEAHPALTPGKAVFGLATDVVPAFMPLDEMKLSPYPTTMALFCVQRPRHIDYRGHWITMWEAGFSDPEDVTHEVAHHLHFVDG